MRYYKELFEDAGSENENELIESLGSPESIAENIIKESGMICEDKINLNKSSDNKKSDAWQDKLRNIDKKTLIILGIIVIVLLATLDDLILPLSAILAITCIVLASISQKKQEPTKKDISTDFEKKKISRDGKSILLIALLLLITSPIWISIIITVFVVIISIIIAVLALTFTLTVTGVALFGTGLSVLFTSFGVGLLLSGVGLILIGLVIIALIPLCSLTFRLCRWILNISIEIIQSVFYQKEAIK